MMIDNALIFKKHPIFSDYIITDRGDVISLLTGRVMTGQINSVNGYVYFGLRKDGETILKCGHRLVAETFLGLSDLEVNHKDKVRTNNNLKNLEYVTSSENTIHSRMGKKRFVFCNGTSKNNKYYIKISRKGSPLIPGGKLFNKKEEAYTFARELYKQHFGVYPW